MNEIKKNLLIFLIAILITLFFLTKSHSIEFNNFLCLKNDEVNLRQGPSFEYPIKFVYKKKYLPLEVLDRSDAWRKVKDLEKNSGWIHVSQLSKKKTAININSNELLYKKPTIYSKPVAKLESGRLVLIKKCKKEWCKIKTGNYSGWIFKNALWGRIK